MQRKFFKKSSLQSNNSVHWSNYAIAGSLLLVIGMFLYNSVFFVPVSINGRWIKISLGTTVRDVVIKEKIALKRGDLKDTKGRLLKKDQGRPPGIFINGNEVPLKTVLARGDRLQIRRGIDVVEEVERKIEIITPATYVSGQGAFLSVGSTGHPGLKIVTIRSRTGRAISEEIIRPVKPVVLQRTKYTGDQIVALTFDDGPNSTYTPQILGILQTYQVPATFFVIGSQVRKNDAIMKQITGMGCAVGNHSYTHAMLGDAPASKVKYEIEETEKAIKDTTGVGSGWFRPPGGSTSITVVDAASIEGCKTVLWSVDPLDWMRPAPRAIVDRVISQVHPGAVILLHDGGGDRTSTIQALPLIISELKLRGYSFVTLDQIVGNQ